MNKTNGRKMSNAIKSVLIINGLKNSGVTAAAVTTVVTAASDANVAAGGRVKFAAKAKAAFKKVVKAVIKKMLKIFKPVLRPVYDRAVRKILEIIENSYLASRVNESGASINALYDRVENLEKSGRPLTAGAGAETEADSGAAPEIVVIGAGGHAKVVAETIAAGGKYRVAGFIDPEKKGDVLPGIPVIGGDDKLQELRNGGIRYAALAIGDNALRQKIAEKIAAIGFDYPVIAHPKALVSPSAEIGQGAVVMQGAIIGSCAIVEDFAIINTGSIIEHDNVAGRFSHIAPGCSLAGSVRTGDRAFIGIGSSVIPGISIGNDAIVGAGSSVVRDIPASAVVGGVPAKEIKAS